MKVFIPQAVYHEIAAVGAGQLGAVGVQTIEWIESGGVVNRILVAALQAELDEAEAIAFAIQLEADLLLLDKRSYNQESGVVKLI